MSPDELNRRLAELLGWTQLEEGSLSGLSPDPRNATNPVRELIPNYCGDLNAVHEVVLGLTEDQLFDYRTTLCRMFYQGERTAHKSMQKAIDATGAQRTEALILTLEFNEP